MVVYCNQVMSIKKYYFHLDNNENWDMTYNIIIMFMIRCFTPISYWTFTEATLPRSYSDKGKKMKIIGDKLL